jgi:hypothetical protein
MFWAEIAPLTAREKARRVYGEKVQPVVGLPGRRLGPRVLGAQLRSETNFCRHNPRAVFLLERLWRIAGFDGLFREQADRQEQRKRT